VLIHLTHHVTATQHSKRKYKHMQTKEFKFGEQTQWYKAKSGKLNLWADWMTLQWQKPYNIRDQFWQTEVTKPFVNHFKSPHVVTHVPHMSHHRCTHHVVKIHRQNRATNTKDKIHKKNLNLQRKECVWVYEWHNNTYNTYNNTIFT